MAGTRRITWKTAVRGNEASRQTGVRLKLLGGCIGRKYRLVGRTSSHQPQLRDIYYAR